MRFSFAVTWHEALHLLCGSLRIYLLVGF